MKEITRIHIAKTPYDIELPAKRTLESYIKSLEAYSDDNEIIDDIEIRITEILGERGVQKNGVISTDDVSALKAQLGEPREFMDEDGTATKIDEVSSGGEATRKLYRDIDHRVIGGVLSGIAAFFKINPLWVRLLFVIVALASFGTAFLVYIVLWIAVPPARTAADKLQMAGRPVTVNSIRELNESDVPRSDADSTTARRVVTTLLGIGCVIGATGAATMTVFAALALPISGRDQLFEAIMHSNSLFTAYILAITSGLLLVAFFILGAYASFTQKMTRRVLISICAVIVLGLVSFGTTIGLVHYGSTQLDRQIQENTRESDLKLPSEAKNATSLAALNGRINVQYIVSKDTPTAKLHAVVKDTASLPKTAVAFENNTLKITSDYKDEGCLPMWGCDLAVPTIVIYGPALSRLTASEGASIKYTADVQSDLSITVNKDARVSIVSGVITTLNVNAKDNASVQASQATVTYAEVTITDRADMELGTIQSLRLADMNSCPANSRARLEVWGIGDTTVEVNGSKRPAESTNFACMRLRIEGDKR